MSDYDLTFLRCVLPLCIEFFVIFERVYTIWIPMEKQHGRYIALWQSYFLVVLIESCLIFSLPTKLVFST